MTFPFEVATKWQPDALKKYLATPAFCLANSDAIVPMLQNAGFTVTVKQITKSIEWSVEQYMEQAWDLVSRYITVDHAQEYKAELKQQLLQMQGTNNAIVFDATAVIYLLTK